MRSQVARLLAVLGLLLGAVVVPASVAAACSCGPATPEVVAARNGVVVTGTLTDVDDPGGSSSPHDVVWALHVAQVFKGRAATTTYVIAQDMCGPAAPEPGRLQVFAASAREGRLVLDTCQGLDDPTRDTGRALIAAAGTASPPGTDTADLAGSVAPDLDGGGMSLTTMLVIALVGLLVVTFGGLALAVGLGLLTRRRRARTDGSDDATQRDSNGTPFK
ncbi:hypothetical protein [Terracoccus sp. 273MFTsu3.1]|uniref:hypothetical protein n=1 Tax=Terracoccus sp. 273MFTsu3.1 TaxID=1172188 RepID=UPI0012DDB321|nr:hypothetical protein [Terracoccus sp. 273MFTsu3.1]